MHGYFEFSNKSVHLSSDILIEKIIAFAFRNWKIILATSIFSVAFSFIYLITAIPIYTASTQILLDTRRERSNNIERSMSDFNYDNVGIENMMTILQSSSLINRVVKSQKLLDDPEFNPILAPSKTSVVQSLSNLVVTMFKSNDVKQNSGVPSDDLDQITADIVETFKAAVTVERLPRSFVVSISVKSADAEKAARLANAVADAFAVDALDARLESARRASGWLSERLSQLKIQLRDSEEAVAKFRAENNLVKTANMTLNEQQLSEMNARLVSARTETAEAKVKFDQLQQVLQSGGYEKAQALPDVLKSGVISNLRSQEADVSRREADLVARYGERHPLVVNVRAERADIQKAIIAETERLSINLKNEYEVAKARQQALESNLREITGLTGSDDKIAIRLRELERTAISCRVLS
jgi:succinoglycan biosynthesis transport protein ExoP